MKESLELSQQQRLQQRLHPEQMLYGRLLEMSTPEIEDEVRRVVDENPALTELGAESDNTGVESGEGTFVEKAEQLQLRGPFRQYSSSRITAMMTTCRSIDMVRAPHLTSPDTKCRQQLREKLLPNH